MVHTGKIHIDREDMVNWVNLVFEYELGAMVEQIKVLSKFCFLVTTRSFEEQQHVLWVSSLYMEGRMVAVVPWERDLNSKPIGPTDLLVWIDLLAVDPLLEIHANYLLNKVGRFVFANTSASLSKFANIRGCVLLN